MAQSTPEVKRNSHLKRTYGITLSQYNELLLEQDHKCAICSKPNGVERHTLAVDHNHVTGLIRGLLCHYCNRYIVGRHKEGHWLRKAADYLDNEGTGLFVPKKKRPTKRKKGTRNGI